MAKKYSKHDMVRILKSEIEPPEAVTRQIGAAFGQIGETETVRRRKSRGLRWQVAAALMGAVILGTVTVGTAASLLWNPNVVEHFEVDETQQKLLEEKKVVVPVQASATDSGVTISLEQTLATEKFMYLYFKITAPEDMKLSEDTCFENCGLRWGDGSELNASYGGMTQKKTAETADNVCYMEWFVEWIDKEDRNGRKMCAYFEGLEEASIESPVKTLADGNWEMSWTLDYEPSEETFTVNRRLEHSDITVKEITISPISFEITYDWKRQKQPVKSVDPDGNPEISMEYAPPSVQYTKCRMRDGSTMDIRQGGGSMGYISNDEKDTTYMESFDSDRVYPIEDIVAVIFEDINTKEVYEIPIR